MNKRLSIAIFCILLGLVAILIKITSNGGDITPSQLVTRSIEIASTTIEVQIAQTDSARQKGLSGRRSLDPNTGMLFIFENPDFYGFWMKDMLFAIDIIWLDEDMRIVHIESSVDPTTYPQTFISKVPAKYVLEVLAGFAIQKGLKIGDEAKLDHI